MKRLLIIIGTLASLSSAMAQDLSFDRVARSLYFNIDLSDASGSIIDSFRNCSFLRFNDTVVRQQDLNTSIFDSDNEKAWSSRYVFSFTQSPVPGYKITSGKITVTLVETGKVKRFRSVEWQTDFDSKEEGMKFYDKLKELFSPLSTKQKVEYDEEIGYIAQYSTDKPEAKGIRNVSFRFGSWPATKKYAIVFSLVNEFSPLAPPDTPPPGIEIKPVETSDELLL